MKTFIVALALITTSVYGEVANLSIKNFNFQYTNPQGEGSATFFNRNFLTDQVKVTVEKIDQDFKLVASGAENQEFVLKNAPAFMVDADTMTVSGLHLDLNEKLVLKLTNGNFQSRNDSISLTGLDLDCQRYLSSQELMDQILTGCIQRMSLSTSKFSSQSVDEGLLKAIEESFQVVVKGGVGINSLNLKLTNGKLDLSTEIKAQISGRVRGLGDMSYDQSQGKLTLKIKEVKFGILNITSRVFDELKKNESEKLQVKEPYVYYQLK